MGEAAGRRAPAPLAPAARRSCAGSRAICRRSTPRARFPPWTCCPGIARGSPPTSTPSGDRGADGAPPERSGRRCARRRHQTLIGLLAVTGMRPGEALGLDRQDVDLDARGVHVRAASRRSSARCRCTPRPPRCAATPRCATSSAQAQDASFFATTRGTTPAHPTIHPPFQLLLDQADLQRRRHQSAPAYTISAIMWTAGLCALPGCFRWWGRCRW